MKRWWRWCLLGLILLRLPSLWEPYWYGDEGIYLAIGQGLRQGQVLYGEIHDNKPPLLYWLAAVGGSVFGFRLLLTVWMIATLGIMRKLVEKLTVVERKQKWILGVFVVLTCIPLLEGNIANAEIFMVGPTVLGVWWMLTAKKIREYWWSGLALGIALTIKIPVAAEMGWFLIWMWLVGKKPKEWLAWSLAAVVPMLLWGGYYWLEGVGGKFVWAAITNNFGYLSSWATGTHSGGATSGGLIFRALWLMGSWGVVAYLMLKKRLTAIEGLLIGWFGATLFGATMSERPYPHYLIQLIPAGLALATAWGEKRLVKIATVLLAIVMGVAIVKYKFYFYPTLGYYRNFAGYMSGKIDKKGYFDFFGSGTNQTYQVAQKIREYSDKSDKIFVWGDEAYLYPLSQRLAASKYLVAYHIVDFGKKDELMRELRSVTPALVVYFPMEGRKHEEFDRWLELYYRPVDQVGRVILYKYAE